MKKLIITAFTFIIFCKTVSVAQEKSNQEYKNNAILKSQTNAPTPIQAGITVTAFKTIQQLPVRIVYDSSSNCFYYCNLDGNVYKLPIIAGAAGDVEQIISSSEHEINSLQGLAFYNNSLILVGNHNDAPNYNGYGVVKKCTLLPNGNKQWSTMLTTAIYQSAGMLYDHSFTGVCLSANKDSVFVASGSRTDHGEVKNPAGAHPNTREVPLTCKIFRIPFNASNIFLPNDEALLNASGYVYANGLRNEFDLAINGNNQLFGVENCGDRDDPEEMNWLRQGKHYGFPWRIGGNDNPQRYANYDPSQDKLLQPSALATGIFYNDPTFPAPPSGVIFEEPITNLGPDANWLRNPTTGAMYQSSAVSTFTGHRSPVGLVFDKDSTIQLPYTGNGFVLAYSKGGVNYMPTEDAAADLCQLKLTYNNSISNYQVNVTRLVSGFNGISDAEIVGNDIYVTEFSTATIWKVSLPKLNPPVADFTNTQSTNCLDTFTFQNQSTNSPFTYLWNFGDGSTSTSQNPSHKYAVVGTYTVTLTAKNPQGSNTKQVQITVPTTYSITQNILNGTTTIQGSPYINATNIVSNGARATYRANKAILLTPTFKAESGSIFKAEIGGCL